MMDIQGKDALESMSQAVSYNGWTLNKFKEFLAGDILEVGCGIGNFTNELVNFGKVFSIDINNDYVKETKRLIGQKGDVGLGNIENGEYFFKNQKFDTIVCLNVLEHIKNDRLALDNMFQLLKKKGKLILLVPQHKSLFGEIDRSISHYRRYDKRELIRRLEETGFKVVKSRSLNFLGAIGWFVSGKILKEKTIVRNKIKIFNFFSPFILPIEDIFEPIIGTSILVIAQKI